MSRKLPQRSLCSFILVKWKAQNTMAMNRAFRIHARVAAGVAFHTHQVVSTFHSRKVTKESQNTFPFSPLLILSST